MVRDGREGGKLAQADHRLAPRPEISPRCGEKDGSQRITLVPGSRNLLAGVEKMSK